MDDTMLEKILLGVWLTALACLTASSTGAAQGLLAYALGPSYFHDLQFDRFSIEDGLRSPLGASLVGVRASWWIGLLTGPSLAYLALRERPLEEGARRFARGVALTAALAVCAGIAGAFAAPLLFSATPDWAAWSQDPVGFARAAASTGAALGGATLGAIAAALALWRRPRPPEASRDAEYVPS